MDYIVRENTIVKLNLLSDNVKCSEVKDLIAYWNNYYNLYDKCIKKYSYRSYSEFEMRKEISKLNGENYADDIINDLISNNIINDVRYKKEYIGNFENNLNHSSLRIINDLKRFNILLSDHEIVYLKDLDFNKAKKLVEKVVSKTSNKSYYELVNFCKRKLATNLYESYIIDDVLNAVDYNEKDSLKKLFIKYKKNYNKEKLIKKLYLKGYNYDLIMEVKEELND
ncbi:MAG: hypothetical protein ACK5NF_07195 [Bacilli bacterium]